MNIKKTLLVSVAFAMVASVSFAAEEAAEERYKAPKSYGWTAVSVGLATPVSLPWGIEKWDVFGLDMNIGYSDAMKMYGWEIAAGANRARKTFAGVQTALAFNYSNEDAYGLAVSLCNINSLEFYGLSIDAVGITRNIQGLEMNALGSMTDKTMCGAQMSGLANVVCEDAYGLQAALGANFARRAHGLQASLVYNQTDLLWGCQIGLVNMAFACEHGFQIGLVNVIMDNQIPFLPFVNGYF